MAKLSTSLGIIGVDEQGSGGVPLVFLHGVGSDRSAWAPQLAYFGTTRRTIALDDPGYGESDPARPSGEAPHDRFARAILAALDALEIGQAHICGLSLGGVVAIALAALAPERVASLVIVDSFLVHPDGPAIVERSQAASCDMVALARARVPVLLGAEADPSLLAELEQVMARIDPAAFRLASRAVWAADQRERATAITVPPRRSTVHGW
jgi:3-oxoadipate enol-lactonase